MTAKYLTKNNSLYSNNLDGWKNDESQDDSLLKMPFELDVDKDEDL